MFALGFVQVQQWGPRLYFDIAPTGIPGLDEVLGGGFIRGRTYLVTGETGVGKTLFSLSFLINGVYRFGEPGIYVSVDETYEQFVNGALRFGWDINSLVASGYLRVLVPEMDILDTIRSKEPSTVAKTMVEAIKAHAKAIGARRLVIDPIAPLVSMEKDVQVLREYIRNLVVGIEREVQTTTIITTEVPAGSRAISRYGVEEFLATGVIILGLARSESGFRRYLFVRKMRWQPIQPAIYEFEIQQGAGVVVKGPLKNIYIPYTSQSPVIFEEG